MATSALTQRLKFIFALLRNSARDLHATRARGWYGAAQSDRLGAPVFMRVISQCTVGLPDMFVVLEVERPMGGGFQLEDIAAPPVVTLNYNERWPESLRIAYHTILCAHSCWQTYRDLIYKHNEAQCLQQGNTFKTWLELERYWAPRFAAWQVENGGLTHE